MVAWAYQLAASKASDLGILWAFGTQRCPPCPDCTVTCPAVSCPTPTINITCPTFSCPTVGPQTSSTSSWSSVVGFVTSLVIALFLASALGFVRPGFSIFTSCKQAGKLEVDDENRDLAVKQLAYIRQRNGGSRLCGAGQVRRSWPAAVA